jgi:hypothetical protein
MTTGGMKVNPSHLIAAVVAIAFLAVVSMSVVVFYYPGDPLPVMAVILSFLASITTGILPLFKQEQLTQAAQQNASSIAAVETKTDLQTATIDKIERSVNGDLTKRIKDAVAEALNERRSPDAP